jgi:hypothetical protein
MTQSSKSYFDYLFLLYYISYGYEFIVTSPSTRATARVATLT